MNKNFPERAKYYFLVNSVNQEFGGLTNAMLQRGRIFGEKANIHSDILTFNFNPFYRYIRETLMNKGKINSNIAILNIYEYFSGDNTLEIENNNPIQSVNEPGCYADPVEGKKAFRIFKNGLYVMYKSFEGPDGTLKFIDYFNDNRYRIKREDFDLEGRVRRITYMNYQFNVPSQELFYRKDGTCYLSKWYKIKEGKNYIDRIHLLNNDGEIIKLFRSELQFQQYWLELLTSDMTMKYFLIVDGRAMDSVVLSYQRDNVYSVFVTHSTHLRPPYKVDSTIRLGNRAVLNNAYKPDAIVFLTNQQKRDIAERFGDRKNYFVIPHSYSVSAKRNYAGERNVKRAIVIARYHEEKQLDHVIKAFAKVIKKVPDAVLELYGSGQEEEKLYGLIKQLGIEGNVELKGFTNNASELYDTSAFSILTSKYEGFGLVILESLAHGCPVVSYNIKYGPSDMIENEVNGYLVTPGDTDELSDRMLSLFTQPDKLQNMISNSYESVKSFGIEEFVNRWSGMFNTIVEQRVHRNSIHDFELNLDKAVWKNRVKGIFEIKCVMTLEGKFKDDSLNNADIYFKVINRENKQSFNIKAEIMNIKGNEIELYAQFDIFGWFKEHQLYKGVWDISAVFNMENAYIEKRLGYKKSSSAALDKPKAYLLLKGSVKPYYTKPHGNLSFHIK
ncbi:glycosyltransferase [Bacillus sp. D386]|uniref:glycosyltransferase n=1 Tax=Bacillus sp. D386 TaxID=2587155 RepID=UPI00111E1FFB|nr:glycosyltransferase [Bacillus sp. D386]